MRPHGVIRCEAQVSLGDCWSGMAEIFPDSIDIVRCPIHRQGAQPAETMGHGRMVHPGPACARLQSAAER